jgi:GR25 family glycosyltransferase involved in LPS biosynthesis
VNEPILALDDFFESIDLVSVLIVYVMITEDDVYVDRTLLEFLEEVLAQAIESKEVGILTAIYQVTEMDDLLDVLLF